MMEYQFLINLVDAINTKILFYFLILKNLHENTITSKKLPHD